MFGSIDKKIDYYVDEFLKNNVLASKEEIRIHLIDALNILKKNKDKDMEAIISVFIDEIVNEIKQIFNNYFIMPGIVIHFKVASFEVLIIGGENGDGEKLTRIHLFDVASITKLYTYILVRKLEEKNIINGNLSIKELSNSFLNLGKVFIDDILNFKVELMTKERIDEIDSKDKALNLLYNINLIKKHNYFYSDMGYMSLIRGIEDNLKRDFKNLLEDFILKPLSLNNTFVYVPKEKRFLVTGTPNSILGLPNDFKATIMGGYSGHAGVKVNSSDLITFGENIIKNRDFLSLKELQNLYKPGSSLHKSYNGLAYINNINCMKKSYVDKLYSNKSFAFQGSTKAFLNLGIYSINNKDFTNVSTILTNPFAINHNVIEELEKMVNKERLKNNLNPVKIICEYDIYDENGKKQNVRTVKPDMFAKYIIPSQVTNKLSSLVARAVLKLTFLNAVFEGCLDECKTEVYIEKQERKEKKVLIK